MPVVSSLFAIHIADGFLTGPWLYGGAILAALLAGAAYGVDLIRQRRRGQPLREEELAYLALMTAAFFVASSIHVRIGPSSVHLLLNGLLGVALRWRAALAIPVGLLLQALFVGHGGWTTLGVNSCILVVPALLAWLLFAVLYHPPWLRRRGYRASLVALSVWVWLLSGIYTLGLLGSNFGVSLDHLDPTWVNELILHPATLTLVGLLGAVAAWLEPWLEHGPEFPLGLLLGVVTVLLTMVGNALVLLAGGDEDFASLVLLLSVAHMPVAAIEGVVLGSLLAFLTRVKPALLGITAPPG